MKWSFISTFGSLLAAGSALAQYSYSPPAPYADRASTHPFAERSASVFPNTTNVVMRTPAEVMRDLRKRLPAAGGDPEQIVLPLRNGSLDKAVNCGRVSVLYPSGLNSRLAGAGAPAASPNAAFMAWRPYGPVMMAGSTAAIEADATVLVEPEYGGSAARITVDVVYTVTRTLTLDGAKQPPVTITFTSNSLGEAPARTPFTAMHPVGFGVTPLGNAMNAQPIPRLACMSLGVLEKALLLEECSLSADQTAVLGLKAGEGNTCHEAAASPGSATLADAPAAPEAVSGASRPPR